MKHMRVVSGGLVLIVALVWAFACYVQIPGKASQLVSAAAHNRTNILLELLHAGVDVNTQVGAGQRTALMVAAKRGHLTSVQVLLSYGANPELQDESGWTAKDFALRGGFSNIVEEIQQRNIPRDEGRSRGTKD
jgi:ankyrin repeat protein